MQFLRAIFMGLALAACGPATAQIYRCSHAGGSVSYQEMPCDAAREAALEAERERTRAREAEGGYPVYFVGRPLPLRWRDTRGASGIPRSRPRL
jgi:hypothetical protein